MNSRFKSRPLQERIVYGPIDSRRLGKSLGVNILPTHQKVCSFNCLYCQYGFSGHQYNRVDIDNIDLPNPADIAEALLEYMPRAPKVDVITLAGNGEPTLNPWFKQIVEVVSRQRDMHMPGVPLCILSNSSTVTGMDVRIGLNLIDRKIMKLDAGTQQTFREFNRPRPGMLLSRIVTGLKKLVNVEIQTLFAEGPVCNTDPDEIEAWLGRLQEIRPRAVQIYTVDRIPADSRIEKTSRKRLEEIASKAGKRLPGVEITVF